MPNSHTLIIVFYIVFAALMIFLYGKGKQKIIHAFEQLGVTFIGFLQGELYIDGHRYVVVYRADRRGRQKYMGLRVYKTPPFTLNIRKKNHADELFSDMPFSADIPTQDNEFNQKVKLEGKDRAAIERFFARTEIRQAVLNILNDFDRIEFQTSVCLIKKNGDYNCLCRSQIEEAIKNFAVVSEQMPEMSVDRQKNIEAGMKLARQVVWMALVVFFIAFFIPSHAFIDPSPILLLDFIAAVICAAVFFCWIADKREAVSLRHTAGLIVFFFIGAGFTSNAAVNLLDTWNDQSQGRTYTYLVHRAYVRHSFTGDAYFVSLVSNDHSHPITFRTSKQNYACLVKDRTKYMLLTKRGNFGFEWVYKAQAVPDELSIQDNQNNVKRDTWKLSCGPKC